MTAAPALKGIKVQTGEANSNNSPLIFIEGRKDGRKVVLTQTVLNASGRESAPVAAGSVYTGVFEGISVQKGTNGYEDKRYVGIRSEDGTLTKIKMTSSLSDAMDQAAQLGLQAGDLIQVEYVDTVSTKTGRPFIKFNVQI